MNEMIFLSFSPKWFEYICSGQKIYEHRKRFTKKSVTAYLYLGLPIQKVVAVLELGPRKEIADWLDEYKYDNKAIYRIKDSLTRNRYVMEIRKVQIIEPIDVHDISEAFSDFHIPQSYFYLNKKPELLEFLQARTNVIREFENDFSNISSDEICKY